MTDETQRINKQKQTPMTPPSIAGVGHDTCPVCCDIKPVSEPYCHACDRYRKEIEARKKMHDEFDRQKKREQKWGVL